MTQITHKAGGILAMLDQVAPRLRQIARGDFDRLLRLARFAIQTHNELADCDVKSVIAAVGAAMQVGLELAGPLADAYLIPYIIRGVKQARLEISYRGYQKLARLSPARWEIQAFSVREGDKFTVQYGTNPEIIHEPAMTFDGPITHVYAVARSMAAPLVKFEVMPAAEVERVRARSRASGDNSPWATDWEAMAQKTVVRRLCKRWLDLTPEAVEALAAENEDGTPPPTAAVVETAPAAAPAASLTQDQILKAMDLTGRLRTSQPALVAAIQKRYGIAHCGQLTSANYDSYMQEIRDGLSGKSAQSLGTEQAGSSNSMSSVVSAGEVDSEQPPF